MKRVTLLWALRSPCHLQCQYCYFGTVSAGTGTQTREIGQLSHHGGGDAALEDVMRFVDRIATTAVRRVFLAGGEPLLWLPTLDIAHKLKGHGIEVVVCTNGLPLRDSNTRAALLRARVDGVSVSLDSHDPAYNDRWRTDASGLGWRGVVEGIQALLADRTGDSPRVGVYMVVTAENIEHVVPTASFVAALGVDYFVFQPVSLAANHALHSQLSLDARHIERLSEIFGTLAAMKQELVLPDTEYLRLMLTTIASDRLLFMPSCFGGRDLFFIEPDGTLWDCPSMFKIAECAARGAPITIRGEAAIRVISDPASGRNTDCSCLSVDCVNMWQLMSFKRLLSDMCATDAG